MPHAGKTTHWTILTSFLKLDYRTLSPIQNVEYVSLAVSSENAIENDECDVQRNESSEIEVRGDHSAKVQAIIRTLLMVCSVGFGILLQRNISCLLD